MRSSFGAACFAVMFGGLWSASVDLSVAQTPGLWDGEPRSGNSQPRMPTPEAQLRISGTTVLDFEGLQDGEAVEDFYNGGTGSSGSGPGANFGVSFSSNGLALIDSDAGGGGNFGGEPSPDTVLFFSTGAATTMNVPGGFSAGFSFFYTAVNEPGEIVVYDGVDATGNVLAVLDLPVTPTDGGDPTGEFSPFEPIGVTFSGTARSVDFGGTVNQIAFDNITLGSGTPGGGNAPLPVPAVTGFGTVVMLLSFLMIGVMIVTRRVN